MEEITNIGKAVYGVFGLVDDLGVLMAVIGTALDYWAADHGVSAYVLEEQLKGLVSAAEVAHREMGLPGRRA